MKISDEQIIEAINSSSTMLEAANSIGMPFMSFRYRAKKLGLYKPNQARKGIKRDSKEYDKIAIPLDEILKGLHPHYGSSKLRIRLIKSGIKEERCEGEGCAVRNIWNGKSITLQLDHIDGDSTNHKLNNLRLLCPNCHTQTETHSGKNRKARVV